MIHFSVSMFPFRLHVLHFPVSVMAFSVQTAMHPPQLWQSSWNGKTVSSSTTMALNRHISPHFPHRVHLSIQLLLFHQFATYPQVFDGSFLVFFII